MNNLDGKLRSQSSYSLPFSKKQIPQHKSKNLSNLSITNDQQDNILAPRPHLKSSYTVLQLQMEDSGKVSIHTNRKIIRPYSSIKLELTRPQFVNTGQYFFYSPIKVPSPLHQITLKKQNKSVIVKLPEKKTPIKSSNTSELIKLKIQQAQKKGYNNQKIKPYLHLEPRVSYSKLFQQIDTNPVKYKNKAEHYSIIFNKKLGVFNNQKNVDILDPF